MAESTRWSSLKSKELVRIAIFRTGVPLQILAVVAAGDVEAFVAVRRANQEAAVPIDEVELLVVVQSLTPDLRRGIGVAIGDIEDTLPRFILEPRLAVVALPGCDLCEAFRAELQHHAGTVIFTLGAHAELGVDESPEFLALVSVRSC